MLETESPVREVFLKDMSFASACYKDAGTEHKSWEPKTLVPGPQPCPEEYGQVSRHRWKKTIKGKWDGKILLMP